jgi:hypothetical protein
LIDPDSTTGYPLDLVGERQAAKQDLNQALMASERSSQTFLVTLAQVTAGLLAILTAVAVGYFVFLRDRATSFEDRIAQDRVEIRDQLLRSNIIDSRLMSMPNLLAPGFPDAYRSRNPGRGGADLVIHAANDLLIHSPQIDAALADAHNSDVWRGPYLGRVFFWILAQAAKVIASGTWETSTKPDGAFPSTADEVGFDAWRQDFDKARGAVNILSIIKDQMQADFRRFIAEKQTRQPNLVWFTSMTMDDVFREIVSIQTILSDIDNQRLLRARYVYKGYWFLSSLVCTFLLGVILPLLLLIWNPKTSAFLPRVFWRSSSSFSASLHISSG